MKTSTVSTFGVIISALVFSACGGGAATTANKTVVANTTAVNSVNAPSKPASAPAATTAAAAPADGDVLNIADAGLTMVVPKGFKFSKEGEDTIVKTVDEGVDVRFHIPADGDYGKSVEAGMADLDKYINDIKIDTKAKEETDPNSGLKMTSSDGSGTDEDGKPILWQMTIIDAPKKPVLAVIYAEAESMQKHSADLAKIFNSVKKM